MPIILLEFLIQIGMMLIKYGIVKNTNDTELIKAFTQFAEEYRKKNLNKIITWKRIEDQIKRGSEKWDEIERRGSDKK